MNQPSHQSHPNADQHRWHKWELGLVAGTAAVIASPYLLPLIGIGDKSIASQIASLCGDPNSRGGLTQLVEDALGSTPLVGGMLAGVGWGPAIASGAIGIAGVLAGDYIHRHYDRKGHIPWGKVVKYAALTTSVLIALPSILSGVSMGLTFLANFFGYDAGQWMANAMVNTIGFSGLPHTSPTGLAGLLPHLFTCGRALLPLGAALFANHENTSSTTSGYSAHMVATCVPIRNQPCEVTFQLIDNETGRPLTDAELEVVHTRPLHTMIVDSSLRDYHHLHPTYDPARKCFVAQFTPNLQTGYTMWNDFTVKGEAAPTYVNTPLSAMRGISLPPRVMHTSRVEGDGVAVDIRPDVPLRAGGHHTLTLDIRDATGRPVTDLEPIMGAYAHLVAFSADSQHFLHIHPLGAEPATDTARGTSPLHFHVMPEVEGPTQFFLQIQRGGKIITLPFGQIVAPAQGYEQRVSMAHGHHAALAAG